MEGIGINDSNGLCERQFGCVIFCIKKLPSIDGTDGSEGMMERWYCLKMFAGDSLEVEEHQNSFVLGLGDD